MVCRKPKCFRPKVGRCMKPNPWIMYIIEKSGQGYTREQIRAGYAQWKHDKFGRYTGASKRSEDKRIEAMCSGTNLGLVRSNGSKSCSRSRSRSRSPVKNSSKTALERARKKALATLWGGSKQRLERERRIKSNERRKATKIQAAGRAYVLRRKLNAEREARRARRSIERRKATKIQAVGRAYLLRRRLRRRSANDIAKGKAKKRSPAKRAVRSRSL